MNLEEERDAMRHELFEMQRELLGTQEMLYQVLKSVGEPVVVTQDQINEGIEPGIQISIDHNPDDGAFVFGLVRYDEQSAEGT